MIKMSVTEVENGYVVHLEKAMMDRLTTFVAHSPVDLGQLINELAQTALDQDGVKRCEETNKCS